MLGHKTSPYAKAVRDAMREHKEARDMCMGGGGGSSAPQTQDHYWPAPADGDPTTEVDREKQAEDRVNKMTQRQIAESKEYNTTFGSELGGSSNLAP